MEKPLGVGTVSMSEQDGCVSFMLGFGVNTWFDPVTC